MNDIPETSGREVVETSGKIRMTDIVMDGRGVTLANLGQAKALAIAIADGDVGVPKYLRGNPGAALAIVADARRFGMDAFSLARESYEVKDQIAYQAKVLHAIVLKGIKWGRRPQFNYMGEGKDLQLEIVFTLEDGEEVRHLSPKVGEITVQNSPLWKTDVRQQLGYYTARAAARLQFPEVMLGMYTPEEREALTIDVTPKTSGVGKRLAGQPDGPSHTATAKEQLARAGKAIMEGIPKIYGEAARQVIALDAATATPDAPEASDGSPVPAEEKNAPAPPPAAPEAPPAEEQGPKDYKPPYGPDEEAFTLTEDERRLLYGLSEMLAVVTNDRELDAVIEQWIAQPFSERRVASIGEERIAKKRETLAKRKKK